MQASSYCKLPKPFCDSDIIVSKQNEDNDGFSWCTLAHLHEVDTHREKVSRFEK